MTLAMLVTIVVTSANVHHFRQNHGILYLSHFRRNVDIYGRALENQGFESPYLHYLDSKRLTIRKSLSYLQYPLRVFEKISANFLSPARFPKVS
jgi:hypothetical protein